MKGRLITAKMIAGFKEHLILEERSAATIQKYIRDVKAFAEYARLCQAAQRRHNERLNLILQTICGTGIRVSELQFITVEAAKCGEAALQRENPHGVSRKGVEAKIAPLCCEAEYSKWNDFCDPHGQAHQPHKYMAGDEGVVRRGRCQPAKGVPA